MLDIVVKDFVPSVTVSKSYHYDYHLTRFSCSCSAGKFFQWKIQDNESSRVVYIWFDLHKVTAVTPCLCASTSHTSLPDCRLCWIFLDNIIIFSLFLTDHCNLPVEESTDKLGAAYSQGAHLKRLEGVLAFATSYDNTSFCHFSSRWWGT